MRPIQSDLNLIMQLYRKSMYHCLRAFSSQGQKSRNFSGLFRVHQSLLYLRNARVRSHQTLQSSYFFLLFLTFLLSYFFLLFLTFFLLFTLSFSYFFLLFSDPKSSRTSIYRTCGFTHGGLSNAPI